jgi:hypothetical protein
MKMMNVSKSSMSLAMIDRRNQTVLKSVPFPDAQNPHMIPPPETVIWHYVRFDYFQSLLKNRALWFTRLDKQSDKTDGTYSDVNGSEMTTVTKKLISSLGIVEMPNQTQLYQTNRIIRKRAYVHCWSMRSQESAWMWNSFLQGEARSVAIRSTIGRLGAALHGQPVEFLRIIYYPPGIPRPDWSYTAPFSAKDKIKHREERELRLLSVNDIGVADESENKLFPTDLMALIGKVVVHPLSSPEFLNEVRSELKLCSINAHVARSGLQSWDLLAVGQIKTHVG